MFNFNHHNKKIDLIKAYNKSGSWLSQLPFLKSRRRSRRIRRILKYSLYFILGLFLLLVIFIGWQWPKFQAVYQTSIDGKNNLEQAIFHIKVQDFGQAAVFSDMAKNDFNVSLQELKKIENNFVFSRFPWLKAQVDGIGYLLATTEVLSRAVSQSAIIGQEMESLLSNGKRLNFSLFDQKEKQIFLEKLYQSAPELSGMKANLDLALLNLEQINYHGILWPLRARIQELEEKIELGSKLLKRAVPLTQILPALAGYPEKSNFLVILQNKDELRPTGGFIGTYSIVETEQGDISSFSTHDIYHLDMPVKNKLNIKPPAPLVDYLGVNKWFMRDANWSPDWPTAARKIEQFYLTENRLLPATAEVKEADNISFTGVIAITPKVITDLLSITGPIMIDSEEYSQENFIELLQYKVEKGYARLGIPSWQRKEVIGQIAKELKDRLFNLPADRWQEIIKIIDDNVVQKNILLFLQDESLQKIIEEEGMGGQVKEAQGDYLFVVDANMAALKTDAVISRNINYRLEEGNNGLFAKLFLGYAHHGNFDWKTSRYRTYTRVYVPAGSTLLASRGVSTSEVTIGQELGKTYFGAFLEIEPGEIGNFYFEYKLPDKIKQQLENGQYEFLIQKQPGNDIEELVVDIKFKNELKSYSPIGFYVDKKDNQIIWRGGLTTDREFSATTAYYIFLSNTEIATTLGSLITIRG